MAVEAALDLSKNSCDIIYWVTTPRTNIELAKSNFPKTIFHDFGRVLSCIPPEELKYLENSLPDKELISKMFETESMVIMMMFKKYGYLSIGERKLFYYHLLGYWSEVLKKFKPDVIVYPAQPHIVYDFIVYSLANLYGIKNIFFNFTRIGDRLLLTNDLKVGSLKLKKILAEQASKNDFDLSDLEPDIKELFLKESSKENSIPLDTEEIINRYKGVDFFRRKLKILLNSFKDLSFFKKIFLHCVRWFRGDLIREYKSVQSVPSFNKNFIYVPLQYQPEGSTNPLGGIFLDQTFMIETLASSLPEGWGIYVKEHPTQWLPRGPIFFDYRYRGYYEKISKVKGVKIVPVNYDHHILLERCKSVGTVTGTGGWEVLFYGKPTLIFGYPWYRHAPGVLYVDGPESCKREIKKIEAGFRVDKKEIIKYLVAFGKSSVRAYLEDYCMRISSLTPEENKNNLVKAILEDINQNLSQK